MPNEVLSEVEFAGDVSNRVNVVRSDINRLKVPMAYVSTRLAH